MPAITCCMSRPPNTFSAPRIKLPTDSFVRARRLETGYLSSKRLRQQHETLASETIVEMDAALSEARTVTLEGIDATLSATRKVTMEELDLRAWRGGREDDLKRISMEILMAADEQVDPLVQRVRESALSTPEPWVRAWPSLSMEDEEASAADSGILAPATEAPDAEAPVAERPRRDTVVDALNLNDAFQFEEARQLLSGYTSSNNARARAALSASHLHLAEAAIEQRHSAKAKEHALAAVAHAEAAIEADALSPLGHIWYGLAVTIRAKALDGVLAQAAVVASSVASWEKAHALAPEDPLPLHLLGSFAFITSSLPWVSQAALRRLSPGLKKFAATDALDFLLRSEERQPAAPYQYAVTNASFIGRVYLQQGQPAKARMWLERAVDEGLVRQERLDPTATEAREAAKKALAGLRR